MAMRRGKTGVQTYVLCQNERLPPPREVHGELALPSAQAVMSCNGKAAL